MEPVFFILTISLYFFSILFSLLLFVLNKSISNNIGKLFLVFHFFLLIIWIVSQLFAGKTNNGFDIVFLLFICFGIISSGFYLRKTGYKRLKIYTSLYLLTILFFVISPSRTIGFIGTGTLNFYNPNKIHITENYYLIEQIAITDVTTAQNSYKVIREMGFYHRTIKRDIPLFDSINSIKLINYKRDSILEFSINRSEVRSPPVFVNIDLTANTSKSKITKGR
jgi:hypothetical protein